MRARSGQREKSALSAILTRADRSGLRAILFHSQPRRRSTAGSPTAATTQPWRVSRLAMGPSHLRRASPAALSPRCPSAAPSPPPPIRSPRPPALRLRLRRPAVLFAAAGPVGPPAASRATGEEAAAAGRGPAIWVGAACKYTEMRRRLAMGGVGSSATSPPVPDPPSGQQHRANICARRAYLIYLIFEQCPLTQHQLVSLKESRTAFIPSRAVTNQPFDYD